ncbi:MAG: imelysin family protein [Sneathiella sp.]
MNNYLYGTAFSVLLFTLAPGAQASQTDPVRNIESYALGDKIAGYVPSYSALAVKNNYAVLVLETYTQAHKDSQVMQKTIAAFLANPSQYTLQSARSSWLNARVSYLQTEAFRFYEGPIDYANEETGEEGPEGRLNAWPLNEAFIDYVEGNANSGLVNDVSFEVSAETIRAMDQVEDESDATTGFHAIEFLLWGQDMNLTSPGNRSWKDYRAGEGNNDRRRIYLQTVTTMLVEDLDSLVVAWSADNPDSYGSTFKALDDKEALGRILTALATLSEFELAAERIATGLDSGDQEDEQSCFSDNTLNDFIYDQRGIRNVYFGSYGNISGAGIDSLVAKLAPALNIKMIAALNKVEDAMSRMPYPYDATLASPEGSPQRAAAESVIDALYNQSDVLKDIGKLLGVKVIVPVDG